MNIEMAPSELGLNLVSSSEMKMQMYRVVLAAAG